MLKAIPKRFLPNTVQYIKYTDDTGEGHVYETEVDITNCAMQLKTVQSTSSGQVITISKGVLFIDMINTKVNDLPVNIDDFILDSRIIYRNVDYRINNIEILDYQNGKGVHHLEIMFV